MADNIQVNPSTALTAVAVAAENIAGALVQRGKFVIGEAGVDDGNVSASNPLPVLETSGNLAALAMTSTGALAALEAILSKLVEPGLDTDYSGTITTGGTAQELVPLNLLRRGFWIQNNSAGDLWMNSGGPAVLSPPSLKLPAGVLYETPVNSDPTGERSIIGATTGQAWSAREY